MSAGAPRVVVAYDGSPSAKTAVRAAASLFPAASAVVDTNLRGGTAVGMTSGLPSVDVSQVVEQLLAEARREAEELMREAVELAGTLGLAAEAAEVGPAVPAWAALLQAARSAGADVLVC